MIGRKLPTIRDLGATQVPGDYSTPRITIPTGTTMTIVGTESHGANPWTRYTATYDLGDGQGTRRFAGIVPGHHVAA